MLSISIKEIDKDIREIIIKINQLFFVKQTHSSCSGHVEDRGNCPYVDIEYKYCPHNMIYIEKFNKQLQDIKGCSYRKLKDRHHYGFEWGGNEKNLKYMWLSISNIISEFLKYPEPKHQCFK